MPLDHTITITPYYLLGLIEGEGSFMFAKNNQLHFVLVLTQTQRPLIEAIKKFIDQLSVDIINPLPITIDRCSVNDRLVLGPGKAKPAIALQISNLYFIHSYFIPFLDNLNFNSKKGKDYED